MTAQGTGEVGVNFLEIGDRILYDGLEWEVVIEPRSRDLGAVTRVWSVTVASILNPKYAKTIEGGSVKRTHCARTEKLHDGYVVSSGHRRPKTVRFERETIDGVARVRIYLSNGSTLLLSVGEARDIREALGGLE